MRQPATAKQKIFSPLLARANGILAGDGDRDANLASICKILSEGVPYYDWVGFYLVDPGKRELRLGPFRGDPTEHVTIPFGRGVCGQVAESGQAMIVQDVSGEGNYLSCSPAVQSEIVVPVSAAGEMVAELDIDSHSPAAFSDDDRVFLEGLCRSVSDLFRS